MHVDYPGKAAVSVMPGAHAGSTRVAHRSAGGGGSSTSKAGEPMACGELMPDESEKPAKVRCPIGVEILYPGGASAPTPRSHPMNHYHTLYTRTTHLDPLVSVLLCTRCCTVTSVS